MSNSDNFEEIFKNAGYDQKTRENLLKNKALCLILVQLFKESEAQDLTKVSHLLFTLGSKCKTDIHRTFIAKYVGSEKIKTVLQLDEAIDFCVKLTKDEKINEKEFEIKTGVGITVTKEEVVDGAKKVIQEFIQNKKKLNLGDVLGSIKRIGNLKWADGKFLKSVVDEELAKIPKVEEVKEVKKEEKKEEKKKEEEKGVSKKFEEARVVEDAKNPPEVWEKYLKDCGGKIITRFPPEPNGFLHIGHAKAMNLSFTVASKDEGYTYLRYDDTNPEVEEDIYYKSIKEMVEWMGFKPTKITYTSDYFQQMYDFAVVLIKKGLAYCDPSSPDEMKEQRDKKIDSPYREKYTPEENLKIFEDMKKGKYEEGKMCLRIKMYNPHLRDFVCYRIKYHSHPQTKDKWCIYPSYDFSHCIVDSLENVRYSLCTLEFETRRDSYYWLLKELNLYRPHVYEFSRLNITKNVLSKRRLLELVKTKTVRGWDDPRLLTLVGLRRRGYTPEAIRSFCDDVGVTRVDNTIYIERLEQSCREDLDDRSNRVFAILHPLKVTITNYDKEEDVEAPNHPKFKERGSRKLPFSNVVYIERDDFREVDDKDFFGLAPNKEVGLRFGFNITCTDVIKKDGKIVELKATVDTSKKNKPKGHIHWLAQKGGKDPLKAEIRLYKPLFTIENISEEKEWMKFIDKDSEEILTDCFVDPIFNGERKIFEHYQFERVGFFNVDPDTTKDSLVFNRTVTLKESKEVKNLKK